MTTPDKYNKLLQLTGEILSTIRLNFLRGTIKVDGPPEEFQNLLDKWGQQMPKFQCQPHFLTLCNQSVYEKVDFGPN